MLPMHSMIGKLAVLGSSSSSSVIDSVVDLSIACSDGTIVLRILEEPMFYIT
jgi:hypothetical protein